MIGAVGGGHPDLSLGQLHGLDLARHQPVLLVAHRLALVLVDDRHDTAEEDEAQLYTDEEGEHPVSGG